MGCVNCGRLVHGAMGLIKAAAHCVGIGVDKTPPELVILRRDQCRACDCSTKNPDPQYATTSGLTTKSRCLDCGCLIAAKIRVNSESCPQDKW